MKKFEVLMITFVFNELKYLPHIIEYYKKNDCSIYIIDNYSTDGTYEWLINNKIKCHQVNTNNTFHVRILEDALMKVVKKLKPNWFIFASADLYHITNLKLKHFIKEIDNAGFNQLMLPCISAVPTDLSFMNKLPLPLHNNYALYYKKLTMISKYSDNFYLNGDDIQIPNSNPFISNDGVSINYGPCKPKKEQEVKLLRTRKAWENGMNKNFSVHYEKAKKNNWIYTKKNYPSIFNLKTSKYYKFIKKI